MSEPPTQPASLEGARDDSGSASGSSDRPGASSLSNALRALRRVAGGGGGASCGGRSPQSGGEGDGGAGEGKRKGGRKRTDQYDEVEAVIREAEKDVAALLILQHGENLGLTERGRGLDEEEEEGGGGDGEGNGGGEESDTGDSDEGTGGSSGGGESSPAAPGQLALLDAAPLGNADAGSSGGSMVRSGSGNGGGKKLRGPRRQQRQRQQQPQPQREDWERRGAAAAFSLRSMLLLRRRQWRVMLRAHVQRGLEGAPGDPLFEPFSWRYVLWAFVAGLILVACMGFASLVVLSGSVVLLWFVPSVATLIFCTQPRAAWPYTAVALVTVEVGAVVSGHGRISRDSIAAFLLVFPDLLSAVVGTLVLRPLIAGSIGIVRSSTFIRYLALYVLIITPSFSLLSVAIIVLLPSNSIGWCVRACVRVPAGCRFGFRVSGSTCHVGEA